jgi:probable HAF family extracellular repeat protein
MNRATTAALTLALCLAGGERRLSAQVISYLIEDLGTLPGGTFLSAGGINAAGQATGTGNNANGQNRAVRVAASGGATAASDLGILPGGTFSQGARINSAGQVVGFADNAAGRFRAFRTTATGGIVAASDLGSLFAAGDSRAFDINAAGQVTGSSAYNASGQAHAYRTTPTGVIDTASDLGALPGGNTSRGYAINASGQVAGVSDNGFVGNRAFRTTATGVLNAASDLGTLGGSLSEALALNDAGRVTGWSLNSSFLMHAYRTTATGGINAAADLGVLPGDDESIGASINFAGVVVGVSRRTGSDRAFVFDDVFGLRDLNALIPAGSGWTLSDAVGINGTGQIVGDGMIGGQFHAYRLTPVGVPEPGSLALVAVAALAAIPARRLRIER